MIVIALVLDERRKQKLKLKLKEIEEKKNFDGPLLEPLLDKNKDLIKT